MSLFQRKVKRVSRMGLKLIEFKGRIRPCVNVFVLSVFRIIETISLATGTDSGIVNVLPENGSTPNNGSIRANDKGTLRFGGKQYLFTYFCLCSTPTVSARTRDIQQRQVFLFYNVRSADAYAKLSR